MSMLDYAKYGKKTNEKTAHEKDAGLLDTLGKGAAVLSGGVLAGSVLKSAYDAIRNNYKAKQVFESVANDPRLSKVDKGTLLEWFAAIYHYSPTAATDKATVKELLQQFATFGKVDLQTLKTLSEIEDKATGSRKNRYDFGGLGAHTENAKNLVGISKTLWGKE